MRWRNEMQVRRCAVRIETRAPIYLGAIERIIERVRPLLRLRRSNRSAQRRSLLRSRDGNACREHQCNNGTKPADHGPIMAQQHYSRLAVGGTSEHIYPWFRADVDCTMRS